MKNKIILPLKKVVVNYNARSWCKLPYPNHPKGCPNYNKLNTCPPKSPLFESIAKPPYIIVAVKFNLKEHIKKMKSKHPDWSNKRLKCVLYWQKKVDKYLKEISEKTASKIKNSIIIYRPEAYGVDMFKTCKKIGITLEKDPKEFIWKMSIIGTVKGL